MTNKFTIHNSCFEYYVVASGVPFMVFNSRIQHAMILSPIHTPKKYTKRFSPVFYVVFEKALICTTSTLQAERIKPSCTSRHEDRGPTHEYLQMQHNLQPLNYIRNFSQASTIFLFLFFEQRMPYSIQIDYNILRMKSTLTSLQVILIYFFIFSKWALSS